ncbi:MAG: acyl carrier protein [Alistipes sp.]|nr:acyl carrier protein [Alistipes sp.]
MSEIQEKVVKVIVDKLGINEDSVTPEATLVGDLGADSLDTVEISMALEAEFGLENIEAEAEKFQTVGDIVTYIEQHAK